MVPLYEQTYNYNALQQQYNQKLVQDCYNESDIDNKVQILYKINLLLPRIYRINIPSLITDDYIDTVLFHIEKNMHSL
jgi:hypothetical protein